MCAISPAAGPTLDDKGKPGEGDSGGGGDAGGGPPQRPRKLFGVCFERRLHLFRTMNDTTPKVSIPLTLAKVRRYRRTCYDTRARVVKSLVVDRPDGTNESNHLRGVRIVALAHSDGANDS